VFSGEAGVAVCLACGCGALRASVERRFVFFVGFSLSWRAGSRPGGRGTFGETRMRVFFARQRRVPRGVFSLCEAKLRKHQKYPKERRAEVRAPSGFLALLGSPGVRANSPSAQTCAPLFPGAPALLSPATRQGEIGIGLPLMHSALPSGESPFCASRGAQAWADQGLRMFEPKASLRRPRPGRAPQGARSEAEGLAQQGSFSLPTFFVDTKKVGALPGAHPGTARRQKNIDKDKETRTKNIRVNPSLHSHESPPSAIEDCAQPPHRTPYNPSTRGTSF